MPSAERIRIHVIANHIEPARKLGETSVTVCAKDVQQGMEPEDCLPLVCQVLDSQEFADMANITLIKKTTPSQGDNVCFTFFLHDDEYDNDDDLPSDDDDDDPPPDDDDDDLPSDDDDDLPSDEGSVWGGIFWLVIIMLLIYWWNG